MLVYIGIRGNSDFTMIELITTSVFVLSSVYGGPVASGTEIISTTTAPGVTARLEEKAKVYIPSAKELEKKARNYFKDEPILVEIARCESSFRHLDKNGKILRGVVNKGDLGLMQINEYYHADRAESLGLDLKTLEGNMAYAKDLYRREGGRPWSSSAKCWDSEGEHVALK